MSVFQDKRVLVTGGCGFFGSYLVKELVAEGAKLVRVFDLATSFIPAVCGVNDNPRVTLTKGDIRDAEALYRACEGIDIVFHTASLLRFGRNSSQLVKAVNYDGTVAVLDACRRANVKFLVYTSTCNVVFDGVHPLKGVDEREGYKDSYLDAYSESKAKAEGLVLETARGSMRTCAVRPCGIYGPGDTIFMGRIAKMLKQGTPFSMVAPESEQDFVHVSNLVHGHMLACKGLIKSPDVVNGQAYFINDGIHANTSEFVRPVVEGLGYRYYPSMTMPLWALWGLGAVCEDIAHLMAPVFSFEPSFTRSMAAKSAVTHYFTVAKAQRDLGYRPRLTPQQGLQDMLDHFKAEGFSNAYANAPLVFAPLAISITVIVGMIACTLLATYDPYALGAWPLHLLRAVSLGFVTSDNYAATLKVIALLAWVTHILKSMLIWMRLTSLNVNTLDKAAWAGQVFLLGEPAIWALNSTKIGAKREDPKKK
eukprot:TRINITY_DN6342_c0_g1_i2.p1 TRINITY_DN6342_c0_g1~~TRINITY_DN6342_c0_g1_i2.p1  ORF type:complete len:479 (-),score=101.27 TRINITY_DN6342_c0_g1_i2:20-1456(-)